MSNYKKASSVVVPLLVIALLVISGPAQAITLSIFKDTIGNPLQSSVQGGELLPFVVKVELNDPDTFVPMQRVYIRTTGNNTRTWVLHMDGTVESGNLFTNELQCSVAVDQYTSGYGYGYGYGYLDGYGYVPSSSPIPFGYGYGYGNLSAASSQIRKFSCSLNTSMMFDGLTKLYTQAFVANSTKSFLFNSSVESFTVLPRVISVPLPTLGTINTNTSTSSGIVETPVGNYTWVVYLNGTTIPVELNVTVFVNPPVNVSSLADVSGAFADVYFNITVNDTAWFANITAIELRMFYNESRIPSGVDESTLRPMKFIPGTGWVRLTAPPQTTLGDGTILYASGVNTTGNYVFANLSRFSVFGIGGTVAAAAAPSPGGTYRPQAVVLANSIDKALAADLYGFLRNQGIDVIEATPSNFGSYKTSVRFIIILGGPDAPEGIGEIVRGILGSDEQKFLRTRGNRKMYVKTNVYRTGQVVRIIAGSGRDQTKDEGLANKDDVGRRIKYNLD